MSKRKLLLADDSITIQKVVNLTFADEGIEVTTVGDGDSAMEKLTEVLPDLVMVDVNMPGLTGYQICEKIKQDAALRHIPVILLVGSFEPFDEEESNRVGADAFLTKPFQSIRQLVTQVTDLLNSSDKKVAESTVESAGDSFAETLEMPKPFEADKQKFSDDEFDDEMIQTSQVGSFTLDEAQKFETRPIIQYDAEDFGKTQPLSNEEVKDFAFADKAEESEINKPDSTTEDSHDYSHYTEETVADTEETVSDSEEINTKLEESEASSAKTMLYIDGTESHLEESENNLAEARTEELPYPASASILDLDEDFLELPPVEGEDSTEDVAETVPETAEPVSHGFIRETTTSETIAAESATPTISTDSPQISAELIDLIVQKVIEKMSDKAVKDVAWEVVPQMSELIIRQIAEEKLKD